MFTGLLQPTHLIILLAVALIFLGPKRLPEAARALGQGLREFKASVSHEALPEGAATTHEETHSVQHEETHPVQRDNTAPVRHEETPPVR
jgi:sec-independent protein translocase protein TatA